MKRRRKTARGSVTVFLSLVLVIVLAGVFALLEAARVWGLEKKTATDAEQTSNSLLAEYNPDLWDDYHLLFLDACYGTDTFSASNLEERAGELSEMNLDVHALESGAVDTSSWDLFGMDFGEADMEYYELATDNGGAAFCQEAAEVMESEIALSAVEDIYEYLTESQEDADDVSDAVDLEETDLEVTVTENPIDFVNSIQENGLLGILLTGESVSEKEADLSESLTERSLQEGNYETSTWSGSIGERILFHEYLLKYYGNVTSESEGKALDYELEYLIAGKDSDEANLRSVVNQLIAMREAANYAYLQTDAEKQELALAVATAIAAAALNPELAPALKQAVLLAWAYAESVSDVRLLLDGEKVALVKTSDQWNTDILSLSSSVSSSGGTQTTGLTYEQYLHILLWAKDDSVLAYRAMDLIELNEDIRMDAQVAAFKGTGIYEGSPLFSGFVSIGDEKPGRYYFEQTLEGSYLAEE